MLVLAGGLLLVGMYWTLESALPRGPVEFAYFPFTPAPLPFSPMRGFTFEQLARRIGSLALLAPGLLLLTQGLVSRFEVGNSRFPPPLRLAQVVGLASVCAIAWVMLGILQGRALVDDELTYKVQARLLAEGRIGDPSVPLMIPEPFTILTKAGFTGKYLFGEPVVQVPGVLLGVPALMHLPLAALTLACVWRAVRLDAGERVAAWAVVLVGVSPMFVLTSATALSHTSALFAVAVAWLGLVEIRHGQGWLGACGVALGVGFGLMVRAQTVAPFGGVLALFAAAHLVRARRFGPLAVAALIGAGCLALIGAYNHALTGSATTLPWHLYRPPEQYGFGRPLANDVFEHTVGTALVNLGITGVRFNAWWLGWPLSLGLVGVWLRLGRPGQQLKPLLVAGLAHLAVMFGYYSTGVSDTGPVYYFELLLPAGVLGAHAVVGALDRWPRWTRVALVVHFGLGTLGFTLEQTSRLRREVEAIHGPIEAALAPIQAPAILMTEILRGEQNNLGWIHAGFPRRAWSHSDPIVVFPRVWVPGGFEAARRVYPGRDCWYYRVHPETREPELWRCEDAKHLIFRPLQYVPLELEVEPTAMQLGWYDPVASIRSRYEAWLEEQVEAPAPSELRLR